MNTAEKRKNTAERQRAFAQRHRDAGRHRATFWITETEELELRLILNYMRDSNWKEWRKIRLT